MKRRVLTPPDVAARILALKGEGLTNAELGERFGMAGRSIGRILLRAGAAPSVFGPKRCACPRNGKRGIRHAADCPLKKA